MGRGIRRDSSPSPSSPPSASHRTHYPHVARGTCPMNWLSCGSPRAASGANGPTASTSLQGSSDNTCKVPGLLEMAGSLKSCILNWGSCASPASSSPPSTNFPLFTASLCPPTLSSPFFPPTSAPTLNGRQQVGWPPKETTGAMKSEGWWFHSLAARSNDVLLLSEPESPASTGQVAKAQARRQDTLALYPELPPPDTDPSPVTTLDCVVHQSPPSNTLAQPAYLREQTDPYHPTILLRFTFV